MNLVIVSDCILIHQPSYNIDNKWDTIDILKDSRKNVRSYISYNDWNISKIVDFTSDNIPDLSQYERVILEAGCFYQFRVAGVNSLGVGEFSEVSEIGLISLTTYRPAKLRYNS